MAWFSHHCHYCGFKHRDVDFIVGDANYQCRDRDACQARRDALSERQRAFLSIRGPRGLRETG